MTDHDNDSSVVAIVGAGSIGVAWAVTFAKAGHRVTVYEPDDGRRDAAAADLRASLADLAGFGMLEQPAGEIEAAIAFTGRLDEAVGDAQWVQECAPEKLDLKQAIFRDLIAATPDDTILASSTSAIPVSRFVPEPERRGRCLVVHPGNPPTLLTVAEVVPAPETDSAIVRRAVAFLADAGMSPVVVHQETEGFVFNRLQGALLREAYCLVRDGVVAPDDIDLVVREGLGLRWSFMGPFETADLNTRGGIRAHAERLGPAYARMGAERGQNDPWTPDLVASVAAARDHAMAGAGWDERCRWRDRMLMSIVRAKREALARFGR